ncbi:type II toxin-antitoxin system HicA family toxin [Nodosilinea sp. PGN35]|uniref:type II toxin-antitoxin system HicA family toxin n=1 Tax=Nodosilinea sp. PGN35 TaxID=3020489 RepID=UPI0023B2CF14|nr:type II toxin-antitoxin system HicA family toxin [Nodosilinea sp. TSF1-S3]MDF0364779.1 type II toxin-antitoxin system HicA family toxin [Nodosilinea sp. TSF1-S3]
MAKLPSVTAQELILALEGIGFRIARQKGSHLRMKHDDGRVATIPIHSGKTIGKGLLLKILRDVELSKEELIELLK